MDQALITLINHFKNFIYRDLFYAVSGILLIKFNELLFSVESLLFDPKDDFAKISFAIACFAVGYANQEAWAQTPFLNQTQSKGIFGKFSRKIYFNHTYEIWNDLANPIPEHAINIDQSRLSRTLDLRHAGSVFGSLSLSILAISVFSLILDVIDPDISGYSFHIDSQVYINAIPLSVIGSIAFLQIAWVKTMQQIRLTMTDSG